MKNVKPAAANGGPREIQIADWKPRNQNTLRGFLSVILPSGMRIHNLTVHEKGETRWVGLPAREWVDQGGNRQFAKIIEFSDRATADKFRDQILAALDRYLAAQREPEIERVLR